MGMKMQNMKSQNGSLGNLNRYLPRNSAQQRLHTCLNTLRNNCAAREVVAEKKPRFSARNVLYLYVLHQPGIVLPNFTKMSSVRCFIKCDCFSNRSPSIVVVNPMLTKQYRIAFREQSFIMLALLNVIDLNKYLQTSLIGKFYVGVYKLRSYFC